ncbi:hypothetical protein [Pseudothauera lacus]|uniref:Uncharacterized protein n=1 Tax=Pseudothauera lacus TaxID=2136175 RepID=A0A2T4IF26_9RHOO|nr:hypothetical protein [Pseudothauera lacus]PTD96390.1 hypothetical protein C8261_08715 [Pseudothauera lacus]
MTTLTLTPRELRQLRDTVGNLKDFADALASLPPAVLAEASEPAARQLIATALRTAQAACARAADALEGADK